MQMEKALSSDETDKTELEKFMAESLLLLSNVAMKNKISNEQLLTDKIEEIIDKYEPKNSK